MKTIKLTIGQSLKLNNDIYAQVKITRNFQTMYIENGEDYRTYTAVEWTGKDLPVIIKDCWTD